MDLRIRRLTALFLFVALTAAFCLGAGAAAAPETARGVIGIANRGLISAYPENSLEGVLAAAETGIDAVLADVSLTADGAPVAMEAESAARMLDGAENAAVSAYTLAELQAYRLRDRQGGAHNAATPFRVPSLRELLDAAAETTLVLRFDAAAAQAVSEVVDAAGAGDRVALFLTGKKKAAFAAAAELAKTYTVYTELRSNIVFEVTGRLRAAGTAGMAGVNLKTTNRYGVIYYPSVLRKSPAELRLIADVSDGKTCGAREDTVKWWDDLISRGYNALITDHPADLAAYLESCDAARGQLTSAYEAAAGFTLPNIRGAALNDYKKAYDDALREAETLLADESAALRDMNDARARLDAAVKAIDRNYEALADGSADRTVTAPRILLCALAAAAVIAVQIYFYKKRKDA